MQHYQPNPERDQDTSWREFTDWLDRVEERYTPAIRAHVLQTLTEDPTLSPSDALESVLAQNNVVRIQEEEERVELDLDDDLVLDLGNAPALDLSTPGRLCDDIEELEIDLEAESDRILRSNPSSDDDIEFALEEIPPHLDGGIGVRFGDDICIDLHSEEDDFLLQPVPEEDAHVLSDDEPHKTYHVGLGTVSHICDFDDSGIDLSPDDSGLAINDSRIDLDLGGDSGLDLSDSESGILLSPDDSGLALDDSGDDLEFGVDDSFIGIGGDNDPDDDDSFIIAIEEDVDALKDRDKPYIPKFLRTSPPTKPWWRRLF